MESNALLDTDIDVAGIVLIYSSFKVEGYFYFSCLWINDDESIGNISRVISRVDITRIMKKDTIGRDELTTPVSLNHIDILTIDFYNKLMLVGSDIFKGTIFHYSHCIAKNKVWIVFLWQLSGGGLPFNLMNCTVT